MTIVESGGKHQWLLKLVVALVVVFLPVLVTPQPKGSVPHIVFILADDLGWNDVSWNNPKAITPNLEQLAKEGIILSQSYVQPLCTPTRSAFLTGRYPFTIGRQHGILKPESPTGLLANATLLPQSLKKVGYSTHAVGKWHLGFCDWDYTPTNRGFDTFYGYYNGDQDHYTHNVDTGRPYLENEEASGFDFRNNTEIGFTANGTYDTYLYASYVENLLLSRNPEEPMFLYLALQSVHTPLQVPDFYREPFQYIGDENREILLAMSWAMDDAVGTVVESLKATGHYENSIIIFSSDNGAQVTCGNNWPLRGAKGSLWEGGTRAAGFIHSPLLEKTGFVSNTLLHVTDWYATIMGLAGGETPGTTDGFDQWEALTAGVASPRDSLVYNIDNETSEVNAAIRKGEYKLIVGDPGDGSWTPPPEGASVVLMASDVVNGGLKKSSGITKPKKNLTVANVVDQGNPSMPMGLMFNDELTTQLYNVIADPEERENLSDSFPEIVEDLLQDLQRELLRMVPADIQDNDPSADPKYFGGVWSPGWCQA